MTASAILKIVAAESPFVVMTGGAAERVFRSEMHFGKQRADLISARRARFDIVTSRAVEPVIGMTERRCLVSSRPLGNFRGFSRLVTNIARIYILLAAFRARTMTFKTTVMRVKARRNRERDAAARRFMTGRAVCQPEMSGVVKNDIKTFQSGKRFDGGGCRVRMTNRADSVLRVGKLRRMTTRAGQMTCPFRRGGIVCALVAKRARKAGMFGIRVLKF